MSIVQSYYTGLLLKRSEALTYLKEIIHKDSSIKAEAVLFEALNGSEDEYTIHIKTNDIDAALILEIARQHNLETRKEKDKIIINSSFKTKI